MFYFNNNNNNNNRMPYGLIVNGKLKELRDDVQCIIIIIIIIIMLFYCLLLLLFLLLSPQDLLAVDFVPQL